MLHAYVHTHTLTHTSKKHTLIQKWHIKNGVQLLFSLNFFLLFCTLCEHKLISKCTNQQDSWVKKKNKKKIKFCMSVPQSIYTSLFIYLFKVPAPNRKKLQSQYSHSLQCHNYCYLKKSWLIHSYFLCNSNKPLSNGHHVDVLSTDMLSTGKYQVMIHIFLIQTQDKKKALTLCTSLLWKCEPTPTLSPDPPPPFPSPKILCITTFTCTWPWLFCCCTLSKIINKQNPYM